MLEKNYENFYSQVNKDLEIETVIISEKKESEYYNSYRIKGITNGYKNKKFILYIKKDINLEYGDKIKIAGEFYEPEEARNYKGFSYKKYMQTEKIYGTIKAKSIEIKSKNNINFILDSSNNIRNKLIHQIKSIFPDESEGLLIGLIIGEKEGISKEIEIAFQKSSLAHILAISGTQVSYIILGLTYMVTINKMSKKSGYIFIIFALIAFIFITNFSISVIRASIMSIILIISKIFHKKADIINTFAISILIIIIFNPYSIRSVSLQLSYLGTAGVIFITPVIEIFIREFIDKKRKMEKFIKIISVPIAAQLAILPIMIMNFNTISLTFLISNILVMPLLGISTIGGYLLAFFSFIWLWGAKKLAIILDLFIKVLIFIAKSCANLKLSNIYVTTPNTVSIIVYYSILIIGIYFLKNYSFTKLVARRGSTFLGLKTWRKKMSYPDEMRRDFK